MNTAGNVDETPIIGGDLAPVVPRFLGLVQRLRDRKHNTYAPPTRREGRRASAADGTADHRQQNLHQRRLDESVLSRHRRQLTSLLREIEGAKVGALGSYMYSPTRFFIYWARYQGTSGNNIT